MINPDKKKYKLKKLYNKDLVLIDRQILRWRKERKHQMEPVEKFRNRRLKATKQTREAARLAKASKMFESES